MFERHNRGIIYLQNVYDHGFGEWENNFILFIKLLEIEGATNLANKPIV